MKSHLILSVVVLMVIGFSAPAQSVNLDTRKVGNQRITNLSPAEPPTVKNQGVDPAPAEAKGVVLTSKNWLCGKMFTDADGQKWQLHVGTPETSQGDTVTGWLIRARDRSLVFVSANGGVFVPYYVPSVPAPLQNLQEQLKAKP